VYCTEERDPTNLLLVPLDRAAAKARSDPAWRYRELSTTHHVWRAAPELHATSLIAYCLMPNHFHLLVRQDGEDCSGVMAVGMQWVYAGV
jgi:hypothetical protein